MKSIIKQSFFDIDEDTFYSLQVAIYLNIICLDDVSWEPACKGILSIELKEVTNKQNIGTRNWSKL